MARTVNINIAGRRGVGIISLMIPDGRRARITAALVLGAAWA